MYSLQTPPLWWSGDWPEFYIMSKLTGSDQQCWSYTVMSLCKPVLEALGDLIWVELSRSHRFHSTLHIVSELILHLSSFAFMWVDGHMCAICSFFSQSFLITSFPDLVCLSDVLIGLHLVVGCPVGLLPLRF